MKEADFSEETAGWGKQTGGGSKEDKTGLKRIQLQFWNNPAPSEKASDNASEKALSWINDRQTSFK